ncbi:phosphate/phosphite/phosphonate ABC transporter substrate-binding protein [Dissulfuribacter thermophilus]|nr:phosphate/phosphite/phosphonate ABC transporter substrate-binding protein [Dissulfuribacter thermophilus]
MNLIRFTLATTIALFILFSAPPKIYSECTKNKPATVFLGVITLHHPLVMFKYYQPFVDYLSKKTPYKFELKISQDYGTIVKYLVDGTIDVAILGGFTYLKARKEAGVVPILGTLNAEKKPLCQAIFIAKEDNKEINTIHDIKGKRFAFASEYSTSGNLAPLYYLYSKEGIRLEDLAEYRNLKYHDSVAREVLRGNFDAGVVLGSVAMQYKGMGIKFIGKTDPFPSFLIVARPGAAPEMVHSIEKALLSLDYDDPACRKIMDSWDVNIRHGFTKVSDSDYDVIRKMVSYLNKEGIRLGVKK